MNKRPADLSIGMFLQRLVPPILGWRGFWRTFFNLLVFGLVTVVATWIVHQTEYLIEYGNRFSAVMATGPHRFYMEPAGIVLVSLGGVLVSLLTLGLRRADGRIDALRRLLPGRLARHVHAPTVAVPLRTVSRTALALAAAQIAIYLIQENIEWLAIWGYLPGLSVLFAPQHATVVPLHLLAALCGSVLLWSLGSRARQTRHTLQLVRVLSALVERWSTDPPRPVPPRARVCRLHLAKGILCPRAPPFAA